jgi:tyrosinase
MVDKKRALGLMFDRPKEPMFKEKGEDGIIFDMPKSFITDHYQKVASVVQSRFGDETSQRFSITQSGEAPDVTPYTTGLARDAPFSLWVPKHSKIAGKLIELFMAQKTVDELLSVAAYVRDRINPQLFNYALSVATIHREDTKGVDIPAYVETFPDKFVDPQIVRRVREDLAVIPQGSRTPIAIPIDFTASDREPEHKLWYFREDVGVNLHHWHWHLVYPFEGIIELVAKDRRGELFYYMHEQIMARYNVERLCNNMPKAVPWTTFREPIREGYFPKLDTLVANRAWPARPDGITVSTVRREADEITLNVDDLERWRDRFNQAVQEGFAIDETGERIPLDEIYGIDILGNMMESSILSPNRELYGNFHNNLHNIIAYSHDPDHRHLESFGVIGDATTAMRDPMFYRVHALVDEMFQAYKVKLPPYQPEFLTFSGVTVTSLQAQQTQKAANTLNTFWQQSDANLSRGLDFVPRGDVFARFTHLQHVPFMITMSVTNNNKAQRLGMTRLFMAPRNNFNGQPMSFNDQRMMMIEIDKFVVQCEY